jgi:hypothetical protein
MASDAFRARQTLDTALGLREIARLDSLEGTKNLPYSIKVLLESALRYQDDLLVFEDDVRRIAAYDASNVGEQEIPFIPGRVVLQDFTGVPAVVDLAAMRPPLSASLALLGMPQPWPAAAIAFVLTGVFTARMRTIRVWDQAAIRGSMMWLLLGTMLYTGLLCLSAGRLGEALAVLVALLAARWVSRRIALT